MKYLRNKCLYAYERQVFKIDDKKENNDNQERLQPGNYPKFHQNNSVEDLKYKNNRKNQLLCWKPEASIWGK